MDTPKDQWIWRGNELTMGNHPLDTDSLLREVAEDATPWESIHPETDIGHVHLQVSDLGRAERFYHDLLGLDVMRRASEALFLAAGGYHHHLAVNIWESAGAPPPPANAVGLMSFALCLPDNAALQDLQKRIHTAGIDLEDRVNSEGAVSILIRDPDRNRVEIVVDSKA